MGILWDVLSISHAICCSLNPAQLRRDPYGAGIGWWHSGKWKAQTWLLSLITHIGFLSLHNYKTFKVLHISANSVMKGNQERAYGWMDSFSPCTCCLLFHRNVTLEFGNTLNCSQCWWELAVSIFSLFLVWLLILRVGRRHVFFGSRLVWICIIAAAPWVIRNEDVITGQTMIKRFNTLWVSMFPESLKSCDGAVCSPSTYSPSFESKKRSKGCTFIISVSYYCT